MRYYQNKRRYFAVLCGLFLIFPVLPSAFVRFVRLYYYLNEGIVLVGSFTWGNSIIHISIVSIFLEVYLFKVCPFIRSIDLEKDRLIVTSFFSTREIPMNSIEKIELGYFLNNAISGVSIKLDGNGSITLYCINDADVMMEGILASLKSIHEHRDILRDEKRRSVRFSRIPLATSTLR